MINNNDEYTYTPTQKDYDRIKRKVMKRLTKEQEEKEIMQELLEEKEMLEKEKGKPQKRFK